MEKVKIEDISDKSLLHFTHSNNFFKIEEEGLKPTIGENARGIEINPKIFFSKGIKGALELSEVWMRWLMNKIFGSFDRIGLYQNTPIEEKKEKIDNWFDEFLSGDYLKDNEKKQILFDYYYKYLEERIYLLLDINDKEEYDSSAIDENKEIIKKQQSKIKRAFARVMYGDYSDIDNPIVDEWNMHTIPNVPIKREKIKQVITKEEKEDMLSIIIEMYDKYKGRVAGIPLLEEFIDYAKKRRMIDETVEESVMINDQNNSSRSY